MKKIFYLIIISLYLVACGQNKEQYHEGHDHANETRHIKDKHDEHKHDNHKHDDDIHKKKTSKKNKKDHDIEEHDSLYHIIEVRPQHFNEIIHTSGQILQAQGDEIVISAKHDGIILFNYTSLLTGKEVKMKQVLLTVSGKDLIHDNMKVNFMQAKIKYEKAKANYDRSLELRKDSIISEKDFIETQAIYQNSKNNYDIVKQNYAGGGQKIKATSAGFIKNIFVTEGQFVKTGQPILSIAKNKRLMIQADVPLHHFAQLPNVKTATFTTPYDNKTYDISEMNGKLISYGRTTENNNFFAHIYFEIDNIGNIVTGSFIEIYLKTNIINNAIIIPKSALLEEIGNYFVYIEGTENFEKRYVKTGGTDGKNIRILEGLNSGDHLITENGYRIKLASLSSSLPASIHSH